MRLTSTPRSRLAPPLALFLVFSFLTPLLLVARTARADALSDVGIGSAGLSAVGTPAPSADGVDALATVDLPTGAAHAGYSFVLPSARGAAQPRLGLAYNSSAGVGFAGVGWSLATPSIVRRGRAGVPRFQDAAIGAPDTLSTDLATDDYYIDGALLIPVTVSPPLPGAIPPNGAGQAQSSNGGSHVWVLYRAELDDGCRYFFDGATWVQQTKSGELRVFGTPFDGGVPSVERVDPDTLYTLGSLSTGFYNNPIYRWNLVRDSDASGNTVYYVWDDEHQLFGAPSGAEHEPAPRFPRPVWQLWPGDADEDV